MAFVFLAVVGIFQIGNEDNSAGWPRQWQCHARIRLGRLNHGRPEIYYYHPNGTWAHLPYLAGAIEQLRTNDSISKSLTDTRFYVIRDSARYRMTLQYTWNATTREFEFAGRNSTRR
ncbi:hypothetical protein [Hymenobacter arcticus]